MLVVSGAGGRAFASGADITEASGEAARRDDSAPYESLYHDALARFRYAPIPVIAMIDGYCLGGGLQLALTADLRYATPASEFGIPAARIGLAYQNLGPLAALIGPAVAAEMMFTARRYNAAEAAGFGLVNRVVEQDRLRAFVVGEIAREIADNAPLSVRSAKLSLRELAKPPGERDDEAVARSVQICAASADLVEGRAAFRERRPPRFSGR